MGRGSGSTYQNPNGQVFMSVYMQTGSSAGFIEHPLHAGKFVQWAVVMELPVTSGPRKYPIMPWFVVVI